MPRLTITSGSAGAIFISFRGWLQQLALVREREKKEERNLACVWAPLGLHARRGAPGSKMQGVGVSGRTSRPEGTLGQAVG